MLFRTTLYTVSTFVFNNSADGWCEDVDYLVVPIHLVLITYAQTSYGSVIRLMIQSRRRRLSTNRSVRIWSVIDSGTQESHKLVASLVHDEAANCATPTRTQIESRLAAQYNTHWFICQHKHVISVDTVVKEAPFILLTYYIDLY